MTQSRSSSALVLFSGGQDSTTCLAWALSRYSRVETIGFVYGQRHAIEMHMREPLREALRATFPAWSSRLGEDHVVPIDTIAMIAQSSLLLTKNDVSTSNQLPATFVPGRNLLFLTFAAIVALKRGITDLVAGMCETDYSGYPDCRENTIRAMQLAINLGMEAHLAIETPLMWVDKAETWGLAAELGGADLVSLIIEQTHTCYAGDRGHRHAWGFGCGACDACRLRSTGWDKYARRAGLVLGA